MSFYHFTHIGHLLPIFRDGMLRPTESNVDMFAPHAGPDVVWLLDQPTPFGPGSGDQLHGLYPDKRRIRFAVDVKAIRWLDWAPAKAMDPEWRASFLRAAGGEEVAESWYVWPAPIRASRWTEVRDLVEDTELSYAKVLELAQAIAADRAAGGAS